MKVLNNSWNNASENVKEQILNELLDSRNEICPDIIVCPTGIVSRIINADIVDNPEMSVKTSENLRSEMLNTASKVRNDLELTDFKNKSDVEQTSILKNTLIEKYHNDYKDIIPIETIQKELDSWIAHI
jgi:hypothetical protein